MILELRDWVRVQFLIQTTCQMACDHKPGGNAFAIKTSWASVIIEHARLLSGHVQDQECTRCLGACGALTDLQRVTQGEHIPAE